jgi:uncharacterized phage protein gp47/JayE
MSTFDATGLTVDDFATVLAALIADLQTSFGDNIKTGPDSVFGLLANIIAEGVSDQNELIEQVANAFNPQTASGAALSILVQLNGITRNSDEFSTVTLSCTANTAGASIPAGSLVSDPTTGNQFATDALLVLAPSATSTVAATAVNSGVVTATATRRTRRSGSPRRLTQPSDSAGSSWPRAAGPHRLRPYSAPCLTWTR